MPVHWQFSVPASKSAPLAGAAAVGPHMTTNLGCSLVQSQPLGVVILPSSGRRRREVPGR